MKPKRLNPGTQNFAIQRYLYRGNPLTPLQALNWFKCFRLSARITDLKRAHYRVKRRMVELRSGKVVAQYFTPARR